MKGSYWKLAITAAVAALALAVAPASARKPKVIHYSNAITIELQNTSGQDKIRGTVTSAKAACIAGRRVQIVDSINAQPVPVLSRLTKNNGTYSAAVPGGLLAGHQYSAIIQRKRIFRTKRRTGLCSFAQSSPVTALP